MTAGLLQSVAFLNPWLLLGLAALPALWWLLRVLPPAPRLVAFPAIRFLMGLESDQKAPVSAPWWLVLLRLLAAALIILAVSQPILNPGALLQQDGPLVLVVDDDWSAAADWDARIAALADLTEQADRQGRAVRLITTAPAPDGSGVPDHGVLRPDMALDLLRALKPKPWPADREAAAALATAIPADGTANVAWAFNGLDDPGFEGLASALQALGPVRLLAPGPSQSPVALAATGEDFAALSFVVRRASTAAEERLAFIARGEDGRALGRAEAVAPAGESETSLDFDLPAELQNAITSVAPERALGAGAVALLDARWRRKPVGMIDEASMDVGPALLSESYYVRRALEPIGQMSQGPVETLLSVPQAVIVAPDSARIEPSEEARLLEWIEQGGVLLRFGGPRLAARQGEAEPDPLTPGPLRAGGRVLGGAMLWSEPLTIGSFAAAGPFADLAPSRDVRISRQVLAEPTPDLDSKTWARLSDGTPIVTADRRGEGWLILVHTTANADWSNLALSGLFVEMLESVIDMSRGVIGLDAADDRLAPERVMDGFGVLGAPGPFAASLDGAALESVSVGPAHPPGLYAQGAIKRALNLGPAVIEMTPRASFPQGFAVAGYEQGEAVDLKAALLVAALLLLLFDAVISLWLRGLLTAGRLRIGGLSKGAAAIVAAVLLTTALDRAAFAQSAAAEAEILAALSGTTFAYVRTGDRRLDEISRAGLLGLSAVLNQRTAVEAVDPIGVDLERDQIHFYPLLYWPISDGQNRPNSVAIEKLNDFMATGGTILFDTGDQASAGVGGAAVRTLRRLTAGLEIPPLAPVPPDHVLTKSFYLLQDFPGRWAGGEVWVETEGSSSNDGVSRVIVGGADWASAWAIDEVGQPRFAVTPGGERQREMAYRFGVNLAMYTLTGNYKADQVHVPAILERLGQ